MAALKMSRRAFLAAAMATGAQAGVPFTRRTHAVTSPGFDFTVASRSDIDALLAAARATPSAYSGKTVGILAGDFGTTQIDATGIVCTSTLLFFSVQNLSPTLPGVACDGSPYLAWQRVNFQRNKSSDDSSTPAVVSVGRLSNATAPARVFTALGSTNHAMFLGCEISSDPMATADFNYCVSVSGGNGLSFINGEAVSTSGGATGVYSSTQPRSSTTVFAILNSTGSASAWNGQTLTGAVSGATRTIGTNVSDINFMSGIRGIGTCNNIVIEDCFIHDVKWPFAGICTNGSFQRNRLEDCYTSFGDFEGDISGTIIRDNRGSHIWCVDTDGAPGTTGPHSSVFGFSQGSANTSDVVFEGNVLCMGYRRLQLFGASSFATGPKMNDQGNLITARVDDGVTTGTTGNKLTVTAASLQGLTAGLAAGMAIRAMVAGVADLPDGTTITGQVSGTAGGVGVYTLSNSAAVTSSAANLIATSISTRWLIRSNLIVCNASIGFEFAYAKDCVLAYNTIVTDQTNTGAFPQINWHDEYTGNTVAKNISCGFARLSPSGQNPPDFFASANDNLVLDITATSGAAAYAGMFVGRALGGGADFQLIDAYNALAAFTPNPSGRVASGYGHAAYYNFSTRVSSYPATPTPPASTIALGVNTSRVHFNGSTFSRWTGTSGLALLEMTNANQLSIVWQGRMGTGTDNATMTLIGAKNSAFVLTRIASDNHLRLTLADASGTTAQIDTSFTLTEADGLVVLAFSLDINAYKVYASKGGLVDGFLGVSWNGTPLRLTNASQTVTIGANYSGSAFLTGDVGAVAVHDAFIDLSTSAGLSKIVAQDGRPVAYGSDGSTLFGSAARVAVNGNAAAWNAGINGGTTAAKFVPTPSSALSDAA